MARVINGASGGLQATSSTIPTAWTIAAWIRPWSCGSDVTYGGRILSVQQSTNPYGETILLSMRDQGGQGQVSQVDSRHFTTGTSCESICAAGSVKRGVWQFVAAVHVGIGTKQKQYFGTAYSGPAERGYAYQAAGTGSSSGSGGRTGVGANGALNGYWFNGELAHVAFWSRALSQAELAGWQRATLAAGNGPATTLPAGLVSYWPLNEVGNVAARDMTGTRPLTTSTGTRPSLSPVLRPIRLRRPVGNAAAVTNATVTPAAVSASSAVPAPTVGLSATATPAVVTASSAVPAPTRTASATVAPSAVMASVSVPPATVTVGQTATPAAVTASSAVPAASVLASATPVPAAVTASASVWAPSVLTGANSTAAAPVVTAAAAVPAPAVAASGTAAPATVTAAAVVMAPSPTTAAVAAPPAVAAVASVLAPQIVAPVTVAPATVTATAVVPAPTVASSTARTLNGTSQGFQCLTATGIATAAWTWCGHVNLAAVTGTHYLWYTETSTPARVSSVSVEIVGGQARLRAYQLVANFTYHQATWDLPLPTGQDLTLAVTLDNTNRAFRAYAGSDTIPMHELVWRQEMLQGTAGQAPYSALANSRWYVSHSSGRVSGAVGHCCVTNDTMTVAEMDQVRRYGDPPNDANLMGWWKFEEGSGDSTDASGKGRTMAAVAAPGSTARSAAPPAESANTLTLTSVTGWQLFQRDGTGYAAVPLAGTYAGSPSAIEARFTPLGQSPGSWATVVASPSGGTYSASLTVATGQGTLEVRANHGGTYAYVRRAYVSVGDMYWCVGTSNCTGQGTNYQAAGPKLAQWQFGAPYPAELSNWDVAGTHQWIPVGDPTDANAGSTLFGPSTTWTQSVGDTTRDGTQGGGSWLPIAAGRLLAAHGVPVALSNLGRIASNLGNWRKATGTHYAELRSRCEQMAGQTVPLPAGTAGKAILAVQGENDYGINTSLTFRSNVAAWVNEMAADFGLPTVLMCVGDWPGTNAYQSASNPDDGITLVRNAIVGAVADTANARLGPVTYDMDLADESGDGNHYKTDAELATVADRWYATLTELYYGGTAGIGHGPRVVAAVLSGSTVTVTFDVALDTAAGGYPGVSVYHGAANSAANRLAWVAASPGAGQYTAVRHGTNLAQMVITLGFSPANPVWVGIGEYDLSAGLAVPTATKSISGVTVTLPAEPVTDLAASPAPTAVQATAQVQAPTITATTTVAAAIVSAAATVQTPAVQAGSGITITPATVTVAAAVPAPTATTATTATPGAVSASVSVWAPTISTNDAVTIPAARIAAATTPMPPAISASGAVTAVRTAATATVLAPTISVVGQSTVVLPSTVAATATVRAAAVNASATVLAEGPIGALAAVPAPTVTTRYRDITLTAARRGRVGRRWKGRGRL